MSYDEVKAIALANVTPRVGEVRTDGEFNNKLVKVVGLSGSSVLIESVGQ